MVKPVIRFKDFCGEWRSIKLGDIATFSKGRGYSKSDLCNGDTPIILYGRLYTNYETEIDDIDTYTWLKDNSVVSKGGEIIIPASGETPEDIACASVIKNGGIIIGGDLNVLSVDEKSYDQAFTALSISFGRVHKELAKYAQGKTVVHLHNDEIKKASIAFPESLDEQRSIAEYFKSLDSIIRVTANRVESLTQMKSAAFFFLFPREGETVPLVRFKGFYEEWQKTPLREISHKVTKRNKDLLYKTTFTNSAQLGIVDQLDFFDHEISKSERINNYYVVENDDFVYNPRISAYAPVGPINRNQLGYTGVMSPLYYVFRVFGIDKDFLSCFFKTTIWHKFMRDNGNTGARFDRLSIADDVFVKMPILHPKDLAEQHLIASFFRNLDTQISLQQQRLEKLKQIKAACLDKMFV